MSASEPKKGFSNNPYDWIEQASERMVATLACPLRDGKGAAQQHLVVGALRHQLTSSSESRVTA